MRILIFLPSIERGGCEQAAVNLSRGLRVRGDDVFVCHPLVPRTLSLRDSFQSIGCRYVRWTCGERSSVAWPADNDQYEEAAHLLDQTVPDIIVLMLPEPSSAFGFLRACLEARKRLSVVFQLCDSPFCVPQTVLDLIKKLPIGLIPTYISVSRESVTRLADSLKTSASNVHVLRNSSGRHLLSQVPESLASDTRKTAAPDKQRTVVTIGRITDQKGYRYLIEAASLVTRLMPNTRFVWVGEGEDDVVFRQLIKIHSLSEHFALTGWTDRVDLYLRAADVFVFPSLWEGTPLSISEAMAFGCPIIATDVGGIPEMVSSNEAWLVKPADPAGLGQAIFTALGNPFLSKRKAIRAHRRWMRDSEEGSRRLIGLISS